MNRGAADPAPVSVVRSAAELRPGSVGGIAEGYMVLLHENVVVPFAAPAASYSV